MPSDPGPPPPDQLDATTHAAQLTEIIADKLTPIAPAAGKPRCFMLGGQPGAGKTTLRQPILDALGAGNVLVIDPDELRTYHPHYADFVDENPVTAASRSHPDASAWARELRAAALAAGVNVMLDGTLGWAQGAVETAQEVVDAGYDVEVHAVAVPLEASRLGVRTRLETSHAEAAVWEGDEALRPLPRDVPESIQGEAYRGLPESLEWLSESGLVSRMRVSNRAGDKLADVSGKRAIRQAVAAEANPFAAALTQERDRVWTEAEIQKFADQTGVVLSLMQARRARTAGNGAEQLGAEMEDVRAQSLRVVQQRSADLDRARAAWVGRVLDVEVADPAGQ